MHNDNRTKHVPWKIAQTITFPPSSRFLPTVQPYRNLSLGKHRTKCVLPYDINKNKILLFMWLSSTRQVSNRYDYALTECVYGGELRWRLIRRRLFSPIKNNVRSTACWKHSCTTTIKFKSNFSHLNRWNFCSPLQAMDLNWPTTYLRLDVSFICNHLWYALNTAHCEDPTRHSFRNVSTLPTCHDNLPFVKIW